MRRYLSWLLVPLLAACIDFVDVTEPLPDGYGGMLSVFVHIPGRDMAAGRSADSVYVQALLHPGIDARGQFRRVASDTLWMLGVPLLPGSRSRADGLSYEAVVPVDRSLLQSRGAVVRPPQLVGGAEHEGVAWYAPTTLDADTVVVRHGEDLHLRFGVTPSTQGQVGQYWSLSLGSSAGHISISRSGSVPPSIAIAGSMLPQGTGGVLHAELTHSGVWGDEYGASAPNAGYHARVDVRTSIRWVVRITEP